MENQELMEKLSKYPKNARIYARNNSYLKKEWLVVKYEDTTECIMIK